MMADIAKLRRPAGDKGAPPPLEAAPGNTARAPREKAEAMKSLQFHLLESVFEEFSEAAGREFGFRKGSKTEMFLKIWSDWKSRRGA